jgi:hypothetical protein
VNVNYIHAKNEYLALGVGIRYQGKRDYIYWHKGYTSYSVQNGVLVGTVYEDEYHFRESIYLSVPLFMQLNLHRFFIEIGIATSCDFRSAYYTFSSYKKWKMKKQGSQGDWEFILEGYLGFGYTFLEKERYSLSLKVRNEQELITFKGIDGYMKYPYNTTSLLVGFNYKL